MLGEKHEFGVREEVHFERFGWTYGLDAKLQLPSCASCPAPFQWRGESLCWRGAALACKGLSCLHIFCEGSAVHLFPLSANLTFQFPTGAECLAEDCTAVCRSLMVILGMMLFYGTRSCFVDS
jgi:hypothetical protein